MSSTEELSSENVVHPPRARVEKKRKLKFLREGTTMEDLLDGWTQCSYFIKKKLRMCNIDRSPGSLYCGCHPPPAERNQDISSTDRDVRIPCPLDSTHSVYRHLLKHHLQICNAAKIEKEISSQIFYCLNCNSGPSVTVDTNASTAQENHPMIQPEAEIIPEELVEKINKCYESVVEQEIYRPELKDMGELDEIIRDALGGKDQTAFFRVKHIEQDVLMVHQMIRHGLLQDKHISEEVTGTCNTDTNSGGFMDVATTTSVTTSDNTAETKAVNVTSAGSNTTYVELGAGKGLLGLAVNCADPTSTLVLVERNSNRNKVDKYLREHNRSFHRVRMDIRHCLLPKLPGVLVTESNSHGNDATERTTGAESIDKSVVVIAKHLCGCASDMAIRSMTYIDTAATASTLNNDKISATSATASAGATVATSPAVTTGTAVNYKRGISIATCCHHACNYEDYVGTEFYTSQGFTAQEFDILKIWSGWASLMYSIKGRELSGDTVAGNIQDASTAEATAETNTAENGDDGHTTSALTHTVIRPQNITYEAMSVIGQRVKRILDIGRLHFIREKLNLNAKLVQYCSMELSPECMMIIANEK